MSSRMSARNLFIQIVDANFIYRMNFVTLVSSNLSSCQEYVCSDHSRQENHQYWNRSSDSISFHVEM